MKKIKLGRTDIEVSRLGIGTGTAHPSGHCAQALMDKKEQLIKKTHSGILMLHLKSSISITLMSACFMG
ncbi:MAG: hypothetical protein HZC11_02740 [Nitrospirae bacterium]|nr:hypothetical protein [Nitrospirota bacterium]